MSYTISMGGNFITKNKTVHLFTLQLFELCLLFSLFFLPLPRKTHELRPASQVRLRQAFLEDFL